MSKMYTICYIVCVGMQQWAGINTRNAFGMYSKQLHGKQLSSYELQGWLFSAILNFLQGKLDLPSKFGARFLEALVGLPKPV